MKATHSLGRWQVLTARKSNRAHSRTARTAEPRAQPNRANGEQRRKAAKSGEKRRKAAKSGEKRRKAAKSVNNTRAPEREGRISNQLIHRAQLRNCAGAI
jgi:hypothetical protein